MNNRVLVSIIIIISLFVNYKGVAQIGVGTITPNASAMLDISSTTKGLLAPRMTTVQKNAIATPASGLLVYDTDLAKFNYYNGSTWIIIEANTGRDDYVLVKSLVDFPAPVSNVITLQSGVLYEINGIINLGSNSINLNNSVLVGGNPNSDQLIYSGADAIFSGSEGGLVQFLNLQGSAGATKLFLLNDATLTKNFIIRDCFVSNFGSIGTIAGFGFTFIRTMSYFNNTGGLTFSGANQLYLYDMIWNGTNSGTAITLTGNFNIISMTGGNLMIDSGETGIDITASPTIATVAIIRGAAFTGAGSRTSGTFSKEWEVEAAGLTTEKDDMATGSIYINSSNTTVISAINVPTKVSGTTTAANLFRVDTDSQSNRLRYTGTKTRFFEATITFSLFGGKQDVYAFYIYKNGVRVPSIYVENKIASNGDIGAATIMGTVELALNDYVELWVENLSASANCTINAMNFIIK